VGERACVSEGEECGEKSDFTEENEGNNGEMKNAQ
jgi:hypothetical protein